MAKSANHILAYRALYTIGWSGICILMLFVLALLGGPFDVLRPYFGLEISAESGIFVDCSLYQNRSSDFCKSGSRRAILQEEQRNQEFKESNQKYVPFSLHN